MTYSSPKKEYLYMTHTAGLLEFLVVLISHPLMRRCYSRAQSGCCLLLTGSNQHNVINMVHQWDSFWKRYMMQISLNKVMTRGWRALMSLSKTVKAYCWPWQLKANCFWWSLWTGIEKKAFVTSAAAYHVQEYVFICSRKDATSRTDAATW